MRDYDVRLSVRERLAGEHASDADTRIVEEMGIWNGAVRVDLAVINGELAGYEIKSARDTLARLPNQAALYNEVFDRVHLVAAEKHVAHAEREIPSWWGIIAAHPAPSGVRLELVRAGVINPHVKPLQIARLLWREEALVVLDRWNAAKGVRSATRDKIAHRLAEALPLDDLRCEARRCLKDRQVWLGQPVGDQRQMTVGSEA